MRKALKMGDKLKILIIDDDEVDRLTLIRALKNSGRSFEITQCSDGETGSAYLQKEHFDCLFLDYLLPGSDGLVLLRKIRKEGFAAPIIVITSQGDEKIAVEMMKSGASDYIVKSQISPPIIDKIVAAAIQLHMVENQKKDAIKALKISESRLSEAQKIAKLGNWEIDVLTNTVYWSDQMYHIYELDPAIFSPTIDNHLEAIHPDDRDLFVKLALDCGKEKISHDFRILTRSGKTKHISLQGYSLYKGDVRTKIICAVQDITDRKLAEKELIEAKLIAEESIKIKEQFLANVTHEIRNPLNAIIGFSELILKNRDFMIDDHQKYMNAISNSGKNLLTLINDLLDFSKIKSGKFQLEEIEFDVRATVNDAVDLFKPKALEKFIQLECKISPNVPERLKGDPMRLNQALVNLISNSVKFTEEGYVKLKVRMIRRNQEQCLIRFVVEDTGIGIAPDRLDDVFESFTQASSDTSRKYGGTGLGLAIVKSIVETQGGVVQVKSKLNEGTIFTVQLPYLIPGNESSIFSNIDEENFDEEFKRSFKNKRILLAEDNEINQLLTFSILTDIGCDVTVVSSGDQLVKKVFESRFDLVMTDIEMPGMDGYAASKKIRNSKNPDVSAIPILAITGHALKKEIVNCLEAGMNDYIQKPYNAPELLKKINNLFTKSRTPQLSPGAPEAPGQTIETSYLKKLSGSRELYDQMISIFLSQFPENMNKLNEYFRTSNWKELRHLSHKLKSTYNLFGAQTAKDNLYLIEKECENSPANKKKIDALIRDFISASEKMYDELKEELGAGEGTAV